MDYQIKVTGEELNDLIPLCLTVPGAILQPLPHPRTLLGARMKAVLAIAQPKHAITPYWKKTSTLNPRHPNSMVDMAELN